MARHDEPCRNGSFSLAWDQTVRISPDMVCHRHLDLDTHRSPLDETLPGHGMPRGLSPYVHHLRKEARLPGHGTPPGTLARSKPLVCDPAWHATHTAPSVIHTQAQTRHGMTEQRKRTHEQRPIAFSVSRTWRAPEKSKVAQNMST